MDEEVLTTQDLLEQWRDATRAAELAERLASVAAESAARADQVAVGTDEIALMAERAAKTAERAARSTFARENRAGTLADADQSVVDTRAEEVTAHERYHEAEQVARARHGA